MKSERGVTLVSLLTYVAILLTLMVIIGRITGFFNNGLDDIDAENDSATCFSKLNYCFLIETKKTQEGRNITAIIGGMNNASSGWEFSSVSEEPTAQDTQGTAIKFLETQNVISYVNKKVYYNKTKICDNVEEFNINYKEKDKSITVSMKIDNQDFEQKYTFR